MQVLVTGGTGFIGRKLVASLVARGDGVIVLTRNAGRSRTGFDPRVELVEWDPPYPGAWAERIAGIDAVVHLAGERVLDKRWTAERKRSLRESRVDTTHTLADAIARYNRPPAVFVSASAVSFYGTRHDSQVLSEADGPGHDFLARLAADWEVAAEPARMAGGRVAHPRVGIVLGTDGGMLGRMLPLFRLFAGGPIGDGTQFMSWIHWADAVGALLFALDTTELTGPFNLTAPTPVTMEGFARALGAALHRPARVRIPPFALKASMGAEMAEVLLSGQRAVPARLSALGFRFRFATLEAALDDLVVGKRRG